MLTNSPTQQRFLHYCVHRSMKLSIYSIFLILSCFNISRCISQRISSIFSFGDSLADTGNLITYSSFAQATTGRLPYGITFGHPTGRCSDGRLIIDFIAERFGLPSLPPYLSGNQTFDKGANFAVSGATALDSSFFKQRGLNSSNSNASLSSELEWFKELKPSLCKTTQECKDYFSKSLFVVGEVGVNDYMIQLSAGRSLEEVKLCVPTLIKAISSATERLIEQGATELLVAGIHPFGCSPYFLTMEIGAKKEDYDPRTGCLKNLNNLAKYQNALLRKALLLLQNKYKETRIAYADYYGAIIRLAHSPKHFGFSNGALKACCGKDGPYNFNLTAFCTLPGSKACKDPSTYVNWDGIHLTEAAYRQVAIGLFRGPLVHLY
ncbi:GDSL esterase/lipase At5g45910-like [Typha latifolia]|uniref:GDSL esterase/lipase At5g45910-like n=1 Tax=Typha latifolia TaxID=4733 RepID=UPI003C2F9991